MFRNASFLVVFALLLSPVVAIGGAGTTISAKTERHQWFRDENLKISFAYKSPRWVEANAAEAATRHVINWRARQSGGVIASCYLQSHEGSPISRVRENMIHSKMDQIVSAVMANAYKRDPDTALVSKKATFADNYPVILLERRLTVRSLDRNFGMTLIGVFTAWQGHEILLECGYSDAARVIEREHVIVRGEIFSVLRTLHFER